MRADHERLHRKHVEELEGARLDLSDLKQGLHAHHRDAVEGVREELAALRTRTDTAQRQRDRVRTELGAAIVRLRGDNDVVGGAGVNAEIERMQGRVG